MAKAKTDLDRLLARRRIKTINLDWGAVVLFASGTFRDDTNGMEIPIGQTNLSDFFMRYRFKYANSNIVGFWKDGTIRWIVNGHTDTVKVAPFIGITYDGGVLSAANSEAYEYKIDETNGRCFDEVWYR